MYLSSWCGFDPGVNHLFIFWVNLNQVLNCLWISECIWFLVDIILILVLNLFILRVNMIQVLNCLWIYL